ncbi:MAG: glycosyltransferase, partial [Deltaproteobacteria bacterium]|nr:glycosyltransferase [Deltaproteobacteria bacterium]
MAENTLEEYRKVVGDDVIHRLRQLGERLSGYKVVHINSTRQGGGVAEILAKLVPFMQELGIDTSWEIITGDEAFFQCTKSMHNSLQGSRIRIPDTLLESYKEANRRTAEELRELLTEADVVFIHDPQPAPLRDYVGNPKGKWIWRCHIDMSHPYRATWKFLRRFLGNYNASIFSLSLFARPLDHTQYLIPPSIDPLADKNVELSEEEVAAAADKYGVDTSRPVIVQVSRFDRFKDPVGVIQAYRLAKKFTPDLQLVLAGGSATDDPEGEIVLQEVEDYAAGDPDVKILNLPGDAHRTINALQRMADVVLQKSIKEGFGLTVTEAMWKGKPVIGGNTGGIRLQVYNNHTGFLVNTPEGAALRVRHLLENPGKCREMGATAARFVKENFLITRQLREYLTVMVALVHGSWPADPQTPAVLQHRGDGRDQPAGTRRSGPAAFPC